MTATLPAVRLPSGPVTPHGQYMMLNGQIPDVWLQSNDGSVRIDLMGGRSIPDHTKPESVHIKRDGLTGLVPPWKMIQQKGATEDGVTFIDALGEPIEVKISAIARARDAINLRKVVRYLLTSVDPKKTATLNFFTQDMGHWWSDVRWLKTLPGPLSGAKRRKQMIDLILQADNGFWRTEPDVGSFTFDYDGVTDYFTTDYPSNAGQNWPLRYYDGSPGESHPYVADGELRWHDQPGLFTGGTSVAIGPFKNYASEVDNQAVVFEVGSFQEWTFPDGAENHAWARMGRLPDGSWDGFGVRASVSPFAIEISRYANYVETSMRTFFNLPSAPGEKYVFIAGFPDNARHFQVQRNGLSVADFVEPPAGIGGALSPLGVDYRGIGIGMRAGGAIITQATPASMKNVRGGENVVTTQGGFLDRRNIGDQPMHDELTLFGPGTFQLYNGPGSDDYVEFGPLLQNQVMHIDTHTNTVTDMTSIPASPQEEAMFNGAVASLFSFASSIGLLSILDWNASPFGVNAPQGSPYSLMTGRFSSACAIPEKSPGLPARTYHVKVVIKNGDGSSKVLARGVPLRRLPW